MYCVNTVMLLDMKTHNFTREDVQILCVYRHF